MPTTSVVRILTASIAPVIVISGIGLLLLSITESAALFGVPFITGAIG